MPSPYLSSAAILANVPDGLRDPLLQAFNSIVKNFRERRWEPAELNGGKLCEIVYTILRGHIDGTFPASPTKPSNMLDSCRDLEKADASKFSRSIRVHLPRTIIVLYEIRNNRGVGHVGGDVDSNHMDSTYVLSTSKWVMAELIRIFHNVDTTTATETVDALIDRSLPLVWETGDKRRVLKPELVLS